MFKAVRIENDEQFIHVARYIHINPLTSYVIQKPEDLATYVNSSYSYYFNQKDSDLLNTQFLLKLFPSIAEFQRFTLNQVDYQRRLSAIRHLMLE